MSPVLNSYTICNCWLISLNHKLLRPFPASTPDSCTSRWWWRWKSPSRVWLFATPWNSPGQNTGVGRLSLLPGDLPNPGLLNCRWILYQMSHNGSPRILEWVAHAFSSRSSRPRNWTGFSCIAGRFFTSWATYTGSPYSLLYTLSKWDSWSQMCSFLMPSSLWLYNAISPICTSQKSGKCSPCSTPIHKSKPYSHLF